MAYSVKHVVTSSFTYSFCMVLEITDFFSCWTFCPQMLCLPPSASTWWLHFPSKIGKPEFPSSPLAPCYMLFLGNLIYTLSFLNVIPWLSSKHVRDKYRHWKYSTYEIYMSLKPHILSNAVQVLSVWYISGYLCNTSPRNTPCQLKLHEDPSTKDRNNLHLKVLAGTVFDPFLQNRVTFSITNRKVKPDVCKISCLIIRVHRT